MYHDRVVGLINLLIPHTFKNLIRAEYLTRIVVLAFYEQSKKALEGGASIQNLIKMPVREQIGRFKYTKAEDVEKEYQAVLDELAKEVADAAGKGAF